MGEDLAQRFTLLLRYPLLGAEIDVKWLFKPKLPAYLYGIRLLNLNEPVVAVCSFRSISRP